MYDPSHQLTLEKVFRHPTEHNIAWKDIIGFFNHVGSVVRRRNGNTELKIGIHRLVVRAPRGTEISADEVIQLRHFLTGIGITPSTPPSDTEEKAAAKSDFLSIVVVIDHRSARLFLVESDKKDRLKPITLTPYDPHGFHRHLVHQEDISHYEGQRVPEDLDFYEQIAAALIPAKEILIITHASGKSSAGHSLLDHLKLHHSDIASRVVSPMTADLSDITDREILALARVHFTNG